MVDPSSLEGRISILNVGTRILLKDVMDQYLRTLGDYKTHYAPTLASALRIFQENQIHVVISEVDLSDGSVYRLVKELGGAGLHDDLYFILALEERSDALLALSEEIEADSILIKPFSAVDLQGQIERYKAWKALPRDPWKLLVAEANLAFRERRYRDAEQNYKDAIDSAPTNAGPLCKAAAYFLAKPDPGVAEGMLKRAISVKPSSVQALSMLGSLYLSKGDLDKADEYFKKAHALSPLNPDRSIEMAKLLLDRCAELCRNTVRLDAGNMPAKILLGKLLALQKDYVGAVREIERVMPVLRDTLRNEAQTWAALARKLGGIAK